MPEKLPLSPARSLEEPHPYAEGTEARARHDLFVRDAVITHLQEKLAALTTALAVLVTQLHHDGDQQTAIYGAGLHDAADRLAALLVDPVVPSSSK